MTVCTGKHKSITLSSERSWQYLITFGEFVIVHHTLQRTILKGYKLQKMLEILSDKSRGESELMCFWVLLQTKYKIIIPDETIVGL